MNLLRRLFSLLLSPPENRSARLKELEAHIARSKRGHGQVSQHYAEARRLTTNKLKREVGA